MKCFPSLGLLAVGMLTSSAGTTVGQPTDGPAKVPLRLELYLNAPTCAVHENFLLTVRIVNPNEFPVTLPGFDFGHVEPQVHLVLQNGKTANLRPFRGESARRRAPVTIPAYSMLERHRFIFDDNLACLWWPNEPGIFKLRGEFTLGEVPKEQRQQPPWPIEWACPITEVRVTVADPLDRRAWEWLEPRLKAYDESLRNPKPGDESVGVRKVRIYREFLEHFPDSTYAPAIRWETTKLLRNLLQDWTYVEEHPEAVDLFDECLTFCLKKGGAYAEEFTTWDADAGNSSVLELVTMHERWTLLKRLVEALDRRYPEDQEGILYRRVIVAGMTESLEKAREIAAAMRERFPNGKYLRKLDGVLRYIERKRHALQPARSTP